MKKYISIFILLFTLLIYPTPSHAGPLELVTNNIPILSSGIILFASLYYAYSQSPQYKETVQRLKSSLETKSTARSIVNWILDLCIELDNFILPSAIFNIDKTGIKLAAQKVKNDIGLNNAYASNGNCTPDEHRALQDVVENSCGSAIQCRIEDSIEILNSKIGQHSHCIDARRTINNKCFNGGNENHNTSIKERYNAIDRCQRYLSKAMKK